MSQDEAAAAEERARIAQRADAAKKGAEGLAPDIEAQRRRMVPLEQIAEEAPSAVTAKNLADAQRIWHLRCMPMSEARSLFPDAGIEIQNITGPDTAIRIAPTTIIDASETVMTCFGPIRSSKRPATNAPIAEITLAATPNTTKPMLGGMIGPMTAAADTRPAERAFPCV